ncbi:MAG: hypothetical protein WBL27_00210 [Salinimicrobium sp.]
MKRFLLLTLVLLFGCTAVSHAQLQEGNIMLGADLGSGLSTTSSNGLFGFNLGLNEDSGYNIGISPKVGYFLNDNFLVGAIVNLGYTNSAGRDTESTNTFVYGVQALSRYYIAPSDLDLADEVPGGRFFLETHAGLAGVNVQHGPTTNGFAFGFGPGYSLFVNRSVALEGSVKYNGLAGGGNTDYQHSLGVHIGVQVFLPLSEAEDRVERFKD